MSHGPLLDPAHGGVEVTTSNKLALFQPAMAIEEGNPPALRSRGNESDPGPISC
jgi:hypothetical protein